jgi:Acyclic terpene utilisation family protein AtuA
MNDKVIRIGGASGYWGDASIATPQLLASGNLDYLVYDYLAEVTMSIMARARAKDPNQGFATDFVTATLKPHLKDIAKQGIKVISNAGGVNPQACAQLIRSQISDQGLDLKVAVVMGDDLISKKVMFAEKNIKEMFSGSNFPAVDSIASINAYLGAFPIAHALNEGADIVITGRCVDSAVTLAACIHEFGWQRGDYDKLAQGSLAGHILECGTQATGGNFTDWELVAESLPFAGYPIAEIKASGEFICTKPENSGGIVSVGTLCEQMLYEIGDPQAYLLPDVICDFSQVEISQQDDNRVLVKNAKGLAAPDSYKVSTTYADGFRGGLVFTLYGRHADKKAQLMADNAIIRAKQMLSHVGLSDFSDICIEIIGTESHYGKQRQIAHAREVDIKIAATHESPKGIGILLKEVTGMALTSPPGLTAFAGGRPKPSPVVRLFSMTVPKGDVTIEVDINGEVSTFSDVDNTVNQNRSVPDPAKAPCASLGSEAEAMFTEAMFTEAMVTVPLVNLAWGRSGDKGNKANIGIIARREEFLPYICDALSVEHITELFEHFLVGTVERFYLPGSHALNFLLHDVLGGGGMASLRNDPQGKGYSQILLDQPISVPKSMAEQFEMEIL